MKKMNTRKLVSLSLILLILTPNVSSRLPVKGSPEDKPDLVIASASFLGMNPIAGFRSVFGVEVKNIGKSTAKPIVTALKWGCCQLVNRTSAELVGDSSLQVIFLPLFMHAGEYQLEIEVDPYNDVMEADETNNKVMKSIIVSLPKAGPTAPTELNLGKEEAVWGYTYNLPTKEQLPTIHGLPNYNIMGRKDPNNPSSEFESQYPEPACGTTSLAAILRYLRDSSDYDHNKIDQWIRGGDVLKVFTDPFSIRRYARNEGLNAEVYVDGDFEKVKWFLDRGVAVMIGISVSEEKGVMKAHWVVPICYWEDSIKTQGLESPVIIGYYNPWGYQSAIPQSRFELYWKEMEFGKIVLWNRVYVAISDPSNPTELPPTNAGTTETFYMGLIRWITAAGVHLGWAVSYFGMEPAYVTWLPGIVYTILAAVEYALSWIAAGIVYLARGAWEVLKKVGEWLGEQFRALGCKLFGWGCKSKKEYFYYFYSSSPSCECYRLLNDMLRVGTVGYIFTSQVGDTVPVYEYAEVDEQTLEVIKYFVSTDPSLPETGAPGIRRFLYGRLGYLPESEVQGVPNEKLVEYLNNYQIGYDTSVSNLWVPQYYLEGSKILWMFNMTSETPWRAFLSPDEAGGTRTFPYIATSDGDEKGYHFTREYVVGYVHYNHLPETAPLYRFYDSDKEEFYLTTDLNDEPKDLHPVREMVFSGVVGYIFL
ncbi:MAG: hypothetical protein FGF53_07115, partial [Candidatus Brockarchaeota archaeon]|nr:hypothetical protein [Candidatus Brockarchaeota archaeon]